MKNINNLHTSGKSSTNIQSKRIKGFGYQVLGFGSGSGAGPVEMDYLLIGSGGGGSPWPGGGGGGGGYRTSFPGGTKLPVNDGEVITIGTGAPGTSGQMRGQVTQVGSFEAEGGGSGGGPTTGDPLLSPGPIWYQDGGSGGGGPHNAASSARVPVVPAPYWGMGNLPPVSPSQGNNGSAPRDTPASGGAPAGSGGGGAGGHGNRQPGAPQGGPGGSGATNSIDGTPTTRAGGGGGGVYTGGGTGGGAGPGGGGAGGPRPNQGSPGGANQGGGGGGGSAPGALGGTGGTGTVFLRVPAATAPATLTVTPGTNSVATLGPGDKVCHFTVSGTVVF